jgi:8-oxo-dGTP diphosphatase
MEHAGYWELPGGKVEQGEEKKDCLVREIQEELNIEVTILYYFMSSYHNYTPGRNLELSAFVCGWDGGGLSLQEHQDYKLCRRNELLELQWCAADLPIVAKLENEWSVHIQ